MEKFKDQISKREKHQRRNNLGEKQMLQTIKYQEHLKHQKMYMIGEEKCCKTGKIKGISNTKGGAIKERRCYNEEKFK